MTGSGTKVSPPLPLLLLLLLLAAGVGLVHPADDASLGCRDENGNLVDWYVLYNLPSAQDIKTGNEFIDNGFGYMYYSAPPKGQEDWATGWTMSEIPIYHELSIPGRTLQPFYDQPMRNDLLYAFYSDSPPGRSPLTNNGHTKGVVAFDKNSGFWLVHSVPLFPPPPGGQYDYPATEYGKNIYGQSFLCMTLPSSEMDNVANQLIYNCAGVYADWTNGDLMKRYPQMAKVLNGEACSQDIRERKTTFTTLDRGHTFVSFAKTSEFQGHGDGDLYKTVSSDPQIKTGLLTETWSVPNIDMPTECTVDYKVYNVLGIQLFWPGYIFLRTKDHSKWAVSDNGRNPWVCIGDINRTKNKAPRGGGTVCHLNSKLWELFSDIVVYYEGCPTTTNLQLASTYNQTDHPED